MMEVKPDTPNHSSRVNVQVIGTLELKFRMTTRKAYLVVHPRIKKGLLRLMDLRTKMI